MRARLLWARGLLVVSSAFLLSAGCGGRAQSGARDDVPSAAAGREPAGGSGGGGAAGRSFGGYAQGGRPFFGGGVASIPEPDGGESPAVSGAGGNVPGGGMANVGGLDGFAGFAGFGGHGGRLICLDGRCGYACQIGEHEVFPSESYDIECNLCHCDWDGSYECETKDCDKDCAYLSATYVGNYLQSKYCQLEGFTDPCTRLRSPSLECDCLTPISTNERFDAQALEAARKWRAAGCAPPDPVCPPCEAPGDPYCDTQDGVCRFK